MEEGVLTHVLVLVVLDTIQKVRVIRGLHFFDLQGN